MKKLIITLFVVLFMAGVAWADAIVTLDDPVKHIEKDGKRCKVTMKVTIYNDISGVTHETTVSSSRWLLSEPNVETLIKNELMGKAKAFEKRVAEPTSIDVTKIKTDIEKDWSK